MPDIYTTTYAWDGANYLFPGDYSIQGIIYNKTLFEKNGWKMPHNFKELKELIPKIEEAGVQPSITMLSLPGYGFQYFCNASSTMFLATKSGQKWIKDFQTGKADAETGLADCAKYFQQWIDCGLLNGDSDALAINECRNNFYEGNTAFLVGSMDRLTQNEDGSGDQYGLMPYLSPDGTENMYITSVRRYYGLNKHLEDPGNEQKLEDALHFMEVLSTEEGQKALEGNHASSVSPLKDSEIADDSPYKEAVEEIQKGHGTSAFYVGWEGVISDGELFGHKCQIFWGRHYRRRSGCSSANRLVRYDPHSGTYWKRDQRTGAGRFSSVF